MGQGVNSENPVLVRRAADGSGQSRERACGYSTLLQDIRIGSDILS